MASIETLRNNITRQLGVQTGTYTDAFLTDYINMAYDEVVADIINESNDTLFDDPNWGDLAIGYVDIVAGQAEYDVFKDANNASVIDIFQVSKKDDGEGDYVNLLRKNIHEFSDFNDEVTTGDPYAYMYQGGRIILYSIPDQSVTKGLKFFFMRSQKPFSQYDTTVEPGFASPYHNIITYYAVYLIAGREGKVAVQNNAITLYSNLRNKFVQYLNKKNKDGLKKFTQRSKVIK